ncbi:putative Dynein axonemal heavy chain 6 [Blattamonas nauphoetae]|uniref:Dynein axonemal heavy chain 6 n=1 Tax=Blattamonas nauphoetae TaxID=2049346 RepID=A0ABQ9XV05_9EUKA|nr:putative Dynein axonemal heavy chain 6 [Blattamonas nauphoetae]
MCQSFKHRIPINITFDIANESVLFQSELQERLQRAAEKTAATPEAERFNKLLVRIHSSLSDLESAVCSVVVMSSELEMMSQAFLVNQVPEIWSHVAYPSLKPLSSWVLDLLNRISFIKD